MENNGGMEMFHRCASRSGVRALRAAFCAMVAFSGCGTVSIPAGKLAAPTVLPQTTMEMKTAGFWTGGIDNPDIVILAPEGIKALNGRISNELKLNQDLRALPREFEGQRLRAELLREWEKFKGKRYYLADGTVATDAFWDGLRDMMALEAIPEKGAFRYGLITVVCDQRLLPTDQSVSTACGDVDFDELQNSSFDTGTPVAIMHESRDRKWLYAVGAASAGWVPEGKVVFCPRDQLLLYAFSSDFCVVTSPKADIYLDQAMTRHYGYCRMGARFPLVNPGTCVEIRVPGKDNGGFYTPLRAYIDWRDINPGYLAYTQRTILRQAFSLLNSPYGWGGANGEQDCSSFLQQVFATVGIELPRNSSSQIHVGRDAGPLENAIPGITLLGMKGHIMLYVGSYDGKPYAIHSVWAYRRPGKREDEVRLINRVAVTGLDLGEGTARGSWRQRLISVKTIDN